MLRINKGFTLIEALIAILIVAIIATSIAGLITIFGIKTSDRILQSCLIEASASAIEACKHGVNINQINCAGYRINITVNGNCNPNPNPNTCTEVIAVSFAEGKSFKLEKTICNFE